MTKCGHLYCFTCILHYLDLSDQSWRKCPICYDSIYAKELKSVMIYETLEWIQPKTNQPLALSMKLVKREISSTVYLPNETYDAWKDKDSPPLVSNSSHFLFSRHLMASLEYIILILEKEIQELQLQVSEIQSNSIYLNSNEIENEILYLGKALNQLQESKLHYNSMKNPIRQLGHSSSKSEPNRDFYYFYMSDQGLHYYLHPLDIKILKHEFQDYSHFPNEIHVSVIQIQESTMDEELRKRCKYLSHVPLSCDVNFCEVDWKSSGCLSRETLAFFSSMFFNM